MSDLEQEVKKLQEQVKKLQVLLASTGQQVMQLQVENRKNRLGDLDAKTKDLQSMVPAAAPAEKPRASEYVVESDLTDMAMELQGQLTLIEERNVRRILNSRSKSVLTPLPNSDGEYSPNFPKTVADVQTLSPTALFEQWNFFEMIGDSLEDLLEPETTPNAKDGNARVLQEIYESFAKYIGINPAEYAWKGISK